MAALQDYAGSLARLLDLICLLPNQRLMKSQSAANGTATSEKAQAVPPVGIANQPKL